MFQNGPITKSFAVTVMFNCEGIYGLVSGDFLYGLSFLLRAKSPPPKARAQ
jgi:hypothetical protein